MPPQMTGPTSSGVAAASAGLSALLLAVSFPTFDLPWLAFVGLVPVLWATRGRPARQAGLLGLLAGALFSMINLSWLTHAMVVYGRVPWAWAAGMLVLLALYLGFYMAAFASVWAWAAPRGLTGRLLLPPTLWVALEYGRTYALTGFPWGFLAYTQAGNLPLIQMAAWTGMYGVSWILVLSNATLTLVLDPAVPRVRRALALTVVVALIGALAALGTIRLASPGRGEPFPITVVQGNVSQDVKWLPEVREQVLQRYERLTLRAAESTPALIVWPEAAIPFLLRLDAPARSRVEALARRTGSHLLASSPDAEIASPPRYFNSAFLVAPDRGLAAKYDKVHLVPFGEYVPLRRLLGRLVDKLAQGAVGDFQAGEEYTVFDLGPGRFGVAISYEIYFPAQVRRYVQGGADFLVNITNDAWYGRTAAPYQHLAMAVFRAVENDAYLVRAANTGISAVVDPRGRVLAASELFEEAILVATVRTRASESFYSRRGDWFAWLLLSGAVATAAWRAWPRRLVRGGRRP